MVFDLIFCLLHTNKMLDFIQEHIDHMARSTRIDFSRLNKRHAEQNERRTLKNVFNIKSYEDAKAIEKACISGKLNLKDYGIDPSPVSGELGHGTIGTLGSINRSSIISINSKN